MDAQPEHCPCYSGKPYQECCKPFHEGTAFPGNALQLMRSRYAAYALSLPDYIIHTTHPEHPDFPKHRKLWKQQILHFSRQTQFLNLEIVDFIEEGDIAYVTFTAFLKQGGKDASFTEKSLFIREHQKWLYCKAVSLNKAL